MLIKQKSLHLTKDTIINYNGNAFIKTVYEYRYLSLTIHGTDTFKKAKTDCKDMPCGLILASNNKLHKGMLNSHLN